MTDCRFPKLLESPEILCAFSLLETKATVGGFKTLVGLMVKCSCLEVSGCLLHRKSVDLWVVVVLLAPHGSVELVVRPGLLASGFLEYARCILSQRLLAATGTYMAQVWKWYWSS